MAKKQVIIKEVSQDFFIVENNSPLVKIIEFGYTLHNLLLEAELVEENKWSDFSFCTNLKILDSNNDIIIFNSLEIKNLLDWLDWICRIVITSEGYHNNTNFIKCFISNCDLIFSQIKQSLNTEQIIIEKIKVRK
jgi:hypothetical protein